MKNQTIQPIVRRALSTAAAAALCLTPMMALADTAQSALVVGGSLNLRETATVEARVLGQYPTGTLVEIEQKGAEWSRVTVDGKTGYMMTRYLSDSEKNVSATVRTNTGIGLNLREEPRLSGTIITSFKPGTAVTVLQKGRTWSRVAVDGKEGFMATSYLNFGTTAGDTSTAGKVAVVNNPRDTQVLNLRETASLDAKVLATYRNGAKVTILSAGSTWYKVQTADGKTGYMMAKYLKVTTESGETSKDTVTLYNPNGGSVVNFRKTASLSGAVIRTCPVGTKATVLEKGTDWTKVEIDGVVGYVSTWFTK